MITERFQDQFDVEATVAGAALHRAGAVRLHPGGPIWNANVRDGGRTWDCHVDLETGRVGCTCMQRRDDGPCAHLWAMLLAIDALPRA